MKRIFSLLMIALMLFSLSACSHSAEALSEKYALPGDLLLIPRV